MSSYTFICTSWFYSQSLASEHGHEIFKIDKCPIEKRYTRLYNEYRVINSYIVICTCWFYSHSVSKVISFLKTTVCSLVDYECCVGKYCLQIQGVRDVRITIIIKVLGRFRA